jgi:cyclopropane-fatty-acyl-phospholipid synthase
MLFARFLERLVTYGQITLIDANGGIHRAGDPDNGPKVTLRIRDRSLHHKLLFNPRLLVAEAYIDGRITVEEGSLYDTLAIHAINANDMPYHWLDSLMTRLQLLWQRSIRANPIGRARSNVAHHYDLSGDLYRLFLDRDLQYSCGYFTKPDASLEEAQLAKKRHIAAKLLLRRGQKVLDIGSGWGGMGLYLAETTGVDVTGVTLSSEQLKVSKERAEERRLSQRLRFHLRDYRQEQGPYDRIVSVGMFEHVGVRHYPEFFAKLRDLLTDDGVALLHTIAYRGEPYPTHPFIDKYIFPGGYIPSLSEVIEVVERAGLWITDLEVLRMHYAQTLRHWYQRFQANRDKVAKLYDERFCRMWELYLLASEVSFRHQGHMVAQLQITKSVDAVPLTRDYISEFERNLPSAEHAAA